MIIIRPARRDVLGSRRKGGRLPSQPDPSRAIGMVRTSSSRPGPRPTWAGLALRHDSTRSPSCVLIPPRGTQNPMENKFGLVSTGMASSVSCSSRLPNRPGPWAGDQDQRPQIASILSTSKKSEASGRVFFLTVRDHWNGKIDHLPWRRPPDGFIKNLDILTACRAVDPHIRFERQP